MSFIPQGINAIAKWENYLGEFRGLLPEIFPVRGWSFTKFRHVASLASNAWNRNIRRIIYFLKTLNTVIQLVYATPKLGHWFGCALDLLGHLNYIFIRQSLFNLKQMNITKMSKYSTNIKYKMTWSKNATPILKNTFHMILHVAVFFARNVFLCPKCVSFEHLPST